ncbi:Lipoprotein OS=Streptomyces alboniger OX=132473 GN=CP975_31895 PE=4 SV=1 [Streptomyces alboniger]
MRAIRVASAALLTASVLTLTVPPASATVTGDENNNITSFGFRVTPSTIAAGGQVTLGVDSCDGDTKITSGVFDDAHIPHGQSSTTAQVFWDAKPGAAYEVTFDCKGETGKTDLTIATGRDGDHSRPEHQRPEHSTHKGVKAGTGGSLGGLDAHEIALGAALILGAVGTAYYKARRRTGEDGA